VRIINPEWSRSPHSPDTRRMQYAK